MSSPLINRFSTLAITAYACAPAQAFCFETRTHSDLSAASARQSERLKEQLADIGVSSIDKEFVLHGVPRSVVQWFREGAVREDDTLSDEFARYRNHFFDPTVGAANNGGFTGVIPGTGLFSGFPSPDWGLGLAGKSRQEYSFIDGRRYYLDALTKPKRSERDGGMALTFRTLGQVIHLIQDVAQPQHTRNDSHGSGSLFERYVNRREVREGLPMGAAAIPRFKGGKDYFVNAEQTGLAQYVNRAFVSEATNFRWRNGQPTASDKYQHPVPLPSPEIVQVQDLDVPPKIKEYCGVKQACNMRFYSSGNDRGEVQARASTLSIFADDLERYEETLPNLATSLRFSLNSLNFKAVIPSLVPQAVAYSVGMTDHFFRGKLDTEPDPVRDDTLLVKNLSIEAMRGDFGLYYDDAQGTRFPVRLTGCAVDGEEFPVDNAKCIGAPLAPDAENPTTRLALRFDSPTDPKPAKAGEYMLVFNGTLGEEGPSNGSVGAVVGKQITNPYNGVLYFVGEDAERRTISFKVDKNGVSLVTGEINPLVAVMFDHTMRERAYHFKQAEVKTLPNGQRVHRTLALAVASYVFNDRQDRSVVAHPLFGTMRPQSGSVWTAVSKDPTVGGFEFRIAPTDPLGRQGQLFYSRYYADAKGQRRLESGVVPLPELSSTGYFYTDMSKGALFVSSDGTEVYPRGGTGFRRFGIRITLAAVPVAELFALAQGSSASSFKPLSSRPTNVGQCTVSYIGATGGGPLSPMTSTGTRRRVERVERDIEETAVVHILEDVVGNEVLAYTVRHAHRQLDASVTETCEVVGLDWSANAPRAKVSLIRRQQTQRIDRAVTDYVLPDGVLQNINDNVGVRPSNAGYVCGVAVGPQAGATWVYGSSYVDLSYEYSGFAPCPIVTSDEYVAASDIGKNPKKRIYRALTQRPQDALYFETVADSAGRTVNVLKFRDDVLPAAQFVADASPIGEVFVAAADMSVLVHEPKRGNMPKLTRDMIPNSIVKLLAAVWM